jgi:hypothetical protein
MRLIKPFLVGVTGLFVVITLMSLLITATPSVSRTVVVNDAAMDKVYNEVADLGNWKHWHPLFASNEATVSYAGITKGEGAACSIKYNNKTTHLLITKADTSSISFTLKADGENDISNQILFTSVTSSSQIRVDWIAKTHLHWYPWEKVYAIFVDKLTGPGYETALNGLKLFIETKH